MSNVICNTHEQLKTAIAAGHPHPYAIMAKHEGTRTLYFNGWQIYHPTKATDPREKSYGRLGYRTFFTFGRKLPPREAKISALAEAKAWVEKTYGYKGEWKRNGMRDYVPADIAKAYPLKSEKRTPKADRVFIGHGLFVSSILNKHRAHNGNTQVSVLVRCGSKKRFAEILNTTESHLRNYGMVQETGSDPKRAAIAVKPEVIYYNPSGNTVSGYVDEWFELPADKHPPQRKSQS